MGIVFDEKLDFRQVFLDVFEPALGPGVNAVYR